MRWADIPLTPTTRMLRQFAGLLILFFSALAVWHGVAHGETRLALALLAVALTIGPAGLARPALVHPVFIGWLVLAFPVGWVVSRVVLVIFFALIVPVAVFFRIRGRDPLQLRRSTGKTTYWIQKPSAENVRSYLRQY